MWEGLRYLFHLPVVARKLGGMANGAVAIVDCRRDAGVKGVTAAGALLAAPRPAESGARRKIKKTKSKG